MKNNQKGRSMIEMLGVLSIVGVLSVSGIVLYTEALQKSKINTTISQISELISNIKSVKALRRDFDFTEVKCSLDPRSLIPNGMCKNSENKILTPLGEVKMKNSNNKSYVYFKFNNENDKQLCIKLATTDWGRKIYPIIVSYNNHVYHKQDGNNESVDEPFTLSEAKSLCVDSIPVFALELR